MSATMDYIVQYGLHLSANKFGFPKDDSYIYTIIKVMIQELLEKRDTLTDIAAELYGDLFITVDEFWGSPTERQMSIVDDELAELGWEPEITPEIEALAEMLLQDLVNRGVIGDDMEEDEEDEEF